MLPQSLLNPLQLHLARVKRPHQTDLAEGYGTAFLPYALERKYPNPNREWGWWQYVFPSKARSTDPRSGAIRRHHADEKAVQRAMRHAFAAIGS